MEPSDPQTCEILHMLPFADAPNRLSCGHFRISLAAVTTILFYVINSFQHFWDDYVWNTVCRLLMLF